jgi:hypothetical protein
VPNWIVIEGVKPWDGRYELDLDDQDLTTREWGWVKRFADHYPTTFQDGLDRADMELICTIGMIALWRAGKFQAPQAAELWERLIDAPAESLIQLERGEPAGEEETDAGPPARSSSSSSSINGDGSRTSSERSDATREPTGTRGSATSASDRQTSAS